MNAPMVESARGALALVRAIHRRDQSAASIIATMSDQERADIVINLASFATIWGEMLVYNIQGDMETFIDDYIDQLQ